MIFYLMGVYFVSLLLGYESAFSETTLTIGRQISNTGSRTGLQNAITPPASSVPALALYGITLALIIYGFIKYGWLAGIGIAMGLLFLVAFNKVVFLPKKNSLHFQRIIIGSMLKRYENYSRSGDKLRADAMKELIEKLHSVLLVGYPADVMKELIEKILSVLLVGYPKG